MHLKIFEGIIVDKSKELLVAQCSKFQIGGIPGHRSQEHLFSLKSTILLYQKLKIPLFWQCWDIEKFFDKEILKDGMDTLFEANIHGKLYRLWYELYKESNIKVKTPMGMSNSKESGENITQGSIGGAILSSSSLSKTMQRFFEGSNCEISYADLPLNVFKFQDDSCRFATSLESIQKGNQLMEAVMKRKQLNLNTSKCSLLIFDKKTRIEETKNLIKINNPIKIFNKPIEAKAKHEFLGDILHEEGIGKSTEETVKKRYGRSIATIVEISAFLNDFRVIMLGDIKSGIDIY